MTYRIIPLINAARTNPDRVGDSLYQNFKNAFKGNQMTAFGKRVQTFQGVKALKDLNQYLKTLPPSINLIESPELSKAASEIAYQKGQRGQMTQQKPRVINQKISKMARVEGKVGQLICLNTKTPEEGVAYFLIDDGLMSRKRRRMLLDPSYRYIGVGEANHIQYGTILVLLLAQKLIN